MSESKIKNNIEANRKAYSSSRFGKSGVTTKSSKLSSKNFDKLMAQRGLSKKDSATLKASFDRSKGMKVRHASKGEKFVVTHGKKNASGIFVSKKSLGSTPEKRINRGSLPPSNSAKKETKVTLGKDQNLVYGKIAAQPGFQAKDPKNLPRKGGGTQYVTNGGYKSGAVCNAPKSSDTSKGKTTSNSQSFKNSLAKKSNGAKSSSNISKTKTQGKSQSR